MSRTFITDEIIQGDRSARVLSNNALKVQEQFSFLTLSGTGTGTIKATQGWLHSVVIPATAASQKLWIFDSATASAIGTSASACLFAGDGSVRGSYLLDILSTGAFTYRLSAADASDGITIAYA